jgi:hypothetical protein
MWAPDGRVLYYVRTNLNAPEMIAAELDLSGEPSVRSREPLFEWIAYEPGEPHANYDVSPDGEGFVMVRRGGTARLVLIQNVQELVHGGQR